MKKIFTMFILLSSFNFIISQYSVSYNLFNENPEFFVPNTVDARSYALGRTDITSANGSNAIFSNPALLGSISGMQLQFGGYAKVFDFKNEEFEDEIDEYKKKYPIIPRFSHLSFAMPYNLPAQNLKLGLGAGFYSAMDNTFKISGEYKDGNIKNDEHFAFTGGLNLLSISGAINYKDKYFAGLSLNKSLFSSFGQFGNSEEGDEEYSYKENTKISTNSYCFGAFVKVTPEFSVGLNYRSKFQLKVDDTEWEEEYDGDVEEGEDENVDIDIPSMYGIGVEYKLSSGITLVGEYHSRPFSDYEEGSNRLFEFKYDKKKFLDDGKSYRLGVEFSQSKPIFRLGMFYDAIPLKDDDDDKPKSLLGITGGAQFDFSNILIDGYIEFSTVNFESNQIFDNSDIKISKLSVGITAKYSFGEAPVKTKQPKINTTLE